MEAEKQNGVKDVTIVFVFLLKTWCSLVLFDSVRASVIFDSAHFSCHFERSVEAEKLNGIKDVTEVLLYEFVSSNMCLSPASDIFE